MGKLDIAKKIGKAALQVAGVSTGAGSDKVRALEAEKELLELKLSLAVAELDEERAWLDVLHDRLSSAELGLSTDLGASSRAADIDDTLRTVRGHS